MVAIQQEVPVTIAVLYALRGHWQLGRGAQVVGPALFDRTAPVRMNLAQTQSTSSCAAFAADAGSCPALGVPIGSDTSANENRTSQ